MTSTPAPVRSVARRSEVDVLQGEVKQMGRRSDRTLRISALACTLLAMLQATVRPAFADTIRLRTATTLTADALSVRLADIASLDGPDAERFRELIVRELAPGSTREVITISDVRAILDGAEAHWGRISLSGGTVTIERRPLPAGPVAMRPLSVADRPTAAVTGPRPEPERPGRVGEENVLDGADLIRAETVGGLLVRELVAGLSTSADDLRLGVRPRDMDVLALPMHGAMIRFESGLHGDRVAIAVTTAGEESTRTMRLSFRVLRRTTIAVPSEDVRAGRALTDDVLDVREAWLGGTAAAGVLGAEDLVGRVAQRSLRAGSTVLGSQVREERLVERGDRVTVRCPVGGIVITLTAEARSGGALGDSIELQKPGERERFRAVVTGRGEARVEIAP